MANYTRAFSLNPELYEAWKGLNDFPEKVAGDATRLVRRTSTGCPRWA